MESVLSMSLLITPQVNVHLDISECDAGAAASRENVAQCGEGWCPQTMPLEQILGLDRRHNI